MPPTPTLPARSLPRLLARPYACAARLVLLVLIPFTLRGAGPGTIEGRVFNPASGEYLEKARVSIEGTALETLTGQGGYYRLAGVPAGPARVKVARPGRNRAAEQP